MVKLKKLQNILPKNVKLIDLSADFRLDSIINYMKNGMGKHKHQSKKP